MNGQGVITASAAFKFGGGGGQLGLRLSPKAERDSAAPQLVAVVAAARIVLGVGRQDLDQTLARAAGIAAQTRQHGAAEGSITLVRVFRWQVPAAHLVGACERSLRLFKLAKPTEQRRAAALDTGHPRAVTDPAGAQQLGTPLIGSERVRIPIHARIGDGDVVVVDCQARIVAAEQRRALGEARLAVGQRGRPMPAQRQDVVQHRAVFQTVATLVAGQAVEDVHRLARRRLRARQVPGLALEDGNVGEDFGHQRRWIRVQRRQLRATALGQRETALGLTEFQQRLADDHAQFALRGGLINQLGVDALGHRQHQVVDAEPASALMQAGEI